MEKVNEKILFMILISTPAFLWYIFLCLLFYKQVNYLSRTIKVNYINLCILSNMTLVPISIYYDICNRYFYFLETY